MCRLPIGQRFLFGGSGVFFGQEYSRNIHFIDMAVFSAERTAVIWLEKVFLGMVHF